MAEPKSIPVPALRKSARVRDGQGRLNLAARNIKVTLVIDPAQLASMTVPDGAGPQPFTVEAAGRR